MKLYPKRWVCWWKGHARMKRMAADLGERTLGVATFQCPRCGHTETRKVYQRKPKEQK